MNESGVISKVILLKSYSFFLELFFARLIILFYAKKRKWFPLRCLIMAAAGIPFYFRPNVYVGNFNFRYLIVRSAVFIGSLFLYKESVATLLFATIGSWGIQHVYWNLRSIVFDLRSNPSERPTYQIQLINCSGILIIYSLFLLVFWKFRICPIYNKKHILSFGFASIRLLVTSFLSQRVKEWYITLRFYSRLVALLSLIIRVGYPYLVNLFIKERNLSNEKKSLETRLSLQVKQTALTKETTDLLNRKFHDRKHQILTRKSRDEKQRNKTADEIEKGIDIYSDIARTGNEALDIIITQKALLCSSKNIRFTYILDGNAVRFISTTDLTSLFGNILDNAIEAADKEEGDFRIVKLKAFRQNDFLFIQEDNYCHRKIVFSQDGIPVSDKKDSSIHGYGTKSIRYIVGKYKGRRSFSQEDDVFYLSVLIPLPEDEKASSDTDCVNETDKKSQSK